MTFGVYSRLNDLVSQLIALNNLDRTPTSPKTELEWLQTKRALVSRKLFDINQLLRSIPRTDRPAARAFVLQSMAPSDLDIDLADCPPLAAADCNDDTGARNDDPHEALLLTEDFH